jgi:mannose-6-phosphate isomerase-like protein (cupin superfamily)
VRLLTIEATRRLSFQRHLCRDELFVALDDNIGLDICAEELAVDADPYDEHVKSLILEKGDYVLIPRGVWHRTKASMDRVRLLEIGFGLYDQNYDIERRWDDYERARLDGRV